MAKRTPTIAPGRAEQAFGGVFDAPGREQERGPAPVLEGPERQSLEGDGGEARAPSGRAFAAPAHTHSHRGPNTPVPEYDLRADNLVQGNWRIPARLLAKLRAIRELDGTSQATLVRDALDRHIAALEEARGEPYPTLERHYRGYA